MLESALNLIRMLSPTQGHEFSTNRGLAALSDSVDGIDNLEGCAGNLARFPDFGFDDGTVAIVAGDYYFVVHAGLLARHAPGLGLLLIELDKDLSNARLIEGRPALQLPETSGQVHKLLKSIYDGLSWMTKESKDFMDLGDLLKMFTKYDAPTLRKAVLEILSQIWPTSLARWESRELNGYVDDEIPVASCPHPIIIVNLARDCDAISLLPAAMYDVSRLQPSEAAKGYPAPDGTIHLLSDADLLTIMKGREHASRYLSTFIVNELEERPPCNQCLNRQLKKRTCQAAFELVTFEMLRDANGVVCERNSDPLYAIACSEIMQRSENMQVCEDKVGCQPCEPCRLEFAQVVDATREGFWDRLPEWFGVEVENWG